MSNYLQVGADIDEKTKLLDIKDCLKKINKNTKIIMPVHLYGNLFRDALNKGLEVIPCAFGFFLDHVTWEGVKPFKHFQD